MNVAIRISEIFGPTVQGEGPLIGWLTVFVRTAGCDYRCKWCDTLYAVLPEHHGEWTLMEPAEILARVDGLAGNKPVLISISGGNPALQPLSTLIQLARTKGHAVALETQGSLDQPWFAGLDWLVLSPKPPSSGMIVDWQAVEVCIAAAGIHTKCALKIVVFDDADYAFARDAAARIPDIPLYLQVGNPAPQQSKDADIVFLTDRLRWLVEKAAADRWFNARVLPQLHVLIWGNKRGV